jgi:hypothetical protein
MRKLLREQRPIAPDESSGRCRAKSAFCRVLARSARQYRQCGGVERMEQHGLYGVKLTPYYY